MLTTTKDLHSLLQALATGEAIEAIEDAREAAYPVITDSDGGARLTEDN